MKKIISLFLVVTSLGVFSITLVKAGAPDGLGPWADTVVVASQANTQGGIPVSVVNPIRSNPASALGVAENNTADANFFSLGFGGSVTLGFENGISSGMFVIEATNNPYPSEMATVAVSQDGVNYYLAGTLTQDGTVPLPREVSCGRFVRITDVSDKNLFEPTADGYDVDGVQAQGLSCSTTGRMTGGGSVFTASGERVTHGFQLRCDAANTPQSLEINWGKGNKFHLDTLLSALCTDDPTIDQKNPSASFDTYKGKGTGKFNGVGGYSAEWTFVDAGEPGKNDMAEIVIRNPLNVVVVNASGLIDKGNQQAHN